MRELRSCDFCADDAVGTFEIVPPELEPTEAEQRRVVLCPDCRVRLEALLEPLLARAGVGTDPGSGDRSREVTETGDRDGEAAVGDSAGIAGESAGESRQQRSAGTGRNETRSATGDAETESSTADDTGTESAAAGDADSRPETESDAESLLGDGITFERDERADDDRGDRADTVAVADLEVGDEEADSPAMADSDGQPEPDAESTDAPNRPPGAYNKVIRLLRNREFPMKRSAVEELAAGAYDLESDEVEAVVDYAVADGEFVEKRGTLRRP